MIAALPPEVREERERAERELDERLERSERKEQKEIERLGLSKLEGALFLYLKNGRPAIEVEVIEWVYGVEWGDLGPIRRRRYRRRLRTRQHTLNRKLRSAGYEGRVQRTEPGQLCLPTKKEESELAPSFSKAQKARLDELLRRAFGKPAGKPAPPRNTVAECAAEIREALTDGPLSVWELRRLCREKGYLPGTVKKARKRLGVIARREGYGGNGEWIAYLPPREDS
jgi:hypothetical protein